ncbi:MAG: right-handed parallel beta-helix repeat-containing protein [Thermodesulfobacteriota bacterium]
MKRILGIIFWTLYWVNLSWTAVAVIPNDKITSVAINPVSINIHSGAAYYFTATVQGTGDYDRDLTWSLQPSNAGLLTANGLFIASSTYTGTAQIIATSVGNTQCLATAVATVTPGGGVWQVDSRNAGAEDGSPLYPFRKIQNAVAVAASGDTIKVAQGTYYENIMFPNRGMILLGGFKGGSAADYLHGNPGDFDTRNRLLQATTISSPDRTIDAINMDNWYSNADTYVIDGFTITNGLHGIAIEGELSFFISDNHLVDNGMLLEDSSFRGGGVNVSGVNVRIFNNNINNNLAGRGGGLFVGTSEKPFVIARNTFENNQGGADHAGGVFIAGFRGIFTKNLVRNNKANQSTSYGWGGGLLVVGDGYSPSPDPNKDVELSYNIYTGNEAKDAGGGVFIDDGCKVRMKHELIFKNKTINGSTGDRGAAGLYVDGPKTELTISHCTIADNQGAAGTVSNGIYADDSSVTIANSILWGNTESDIYGAPSNLIFTVTYSDSKPRHPGVGNIAQNPFFADTALDDYHLKSRQGRWHPASNTWVKDAVHSPGIDAGSPSAEFVNEPLPNGAQANLGAYGNTYEASKSNRLGIPVLGLLLLD